LKEGKNEDGKQRECLKTARYTGHKNAKEEAGLHEIGNCCRETREAEVLGRGSVGSRKKKPVKTREII